MNLNLPEERTVTASALLWKRLAAFIIDLVVLDLFVFAPFTRIFERHLPADYGFTSIYSLLKSNSQMSQPLVTAGIFALMLAALYFALMEGKMQQSIGKRFMKLYVISTQNNRKMPSVWQNIIRNLFFVPIFPLVLLWILDPLFMIFTKNNQRLSEIISKTKVVEKISI